MAFLMRKLRKKSSERALEVRHLAWDADRLPSLSLKVDKRGRLSALTGPEGYLPHH